MSVFGGFSSYGGNYASEDPPPIYLSVNIGDARRDHPYFYLSPPILTTHVIRGGEPFWQKIPGWRDAVIMEPKDVYYVQPEYFSKLDNRIPSSILRHSYVIDVTQLISRKSPTPYITPDKIIEMTREKIYYTLAPRSFPDHDDPHDLFIRALSNEELEYLVGHYYDLWMWETGSDEHRNTFEKLLAERDLRKDKGWIVRRPSFEEVKQVEANFGKSAFRKRTHEKLKITLPIPGPKTFSKPHPHKIITEPFGKQKRLQSRSFKEWLNGFLRREPEEL